MKGVLICPAERPAVRLLAENMPLALVPMLGHSLVEYWVGHWARTGIKEILILADDRPLEVRAVVGDGARWGVTIKVIAENRELSAAQALLKYQNSADASGSQTPIVTMDHFPGLEQFPLLTGYADWFAGLQAWMPQARTPDRVGVKEVEPGIWVGRRTHLSRGAKLHAPCWLGQNVFIAEGAVIGPKTVLEDGCFIEPAAEVCESYIGPHTFVGRYSEVKDSLAWGNTLLNFKTGSFAKVPDPFVLCALRQPRPPRSQGLFSRLAELYSRNKEDVHLLWKHLLMNREG